MARGDVKVFDEAIDRMANSWDMDNDTFTMTFITEAYSTINVNTNNPTVATIGTEVSGGTYAAQDIAVTSADNAGTYEFALSSDEVFAQDASGPTNIKTGVIYNNTDVNDYCVCVIEMTGDGGTTAESLQAGAITIEAGNIFTIT